MVRYYGLYSNAHRGKIRKGGVDSSHPLIIEEEDRSVPSKGWTEMIRKVHEVDSLVYPEYQGHMKNIYFIIYYSRFRKYINKI